MYKKEDVELLLDKCDSEGTEYAICEWGDWKEFEGTPLGEAIENYRDAVNWLDEEIDEATDEVGLE